jgi:hypothetical protein
VYIFCGSGLATCRWRQLTSNVRPHNSKVPTVPASKSCAPFPLFSQLVKCASRSRLRPVVSLLGTPSTACREPRRVLKIGHRETELSLSFGALEPAGMHVREHREARKVVVGAACRGEAVPLHLNASSPHGAGSHGRRRRIVVACKPCAA